MTHSVKKIATAKNIPLLALALFAAMFVGSEVLASMKVQAEEHWLLDQCSDPTEPNCYSPVNGDISQDCRAQDNAVCGINAPRKTGTETPVIEGDLLEDLENEDYQNNQNIFRMPYIPEQ